MQSTGRSQNSSGTDEVAGLDILEPGPTPVADAWSNFRGVAQEWNAELEKRRKPSRAVLERAYAAALLVLRAYLLRQNFGPDGRPKEDLPYALVKMICNNIDYVRAGYLPDPVKDMLRPGSPGIGPHESRDIGLAVAYVRAAKDGVVIDRHPVKTVAQWFGVTDRAVRRWQQTRPNTAYSDFFWTEEHPQIAPLLSKAAKDAGRRYREAGRGADGRFEFPRPGKRAPGRN